MVWLLPALPVVGAAAVYGWAPGRPVRRGALTAAATTAMLITVAAAAWAAAVRPSASWAWGAGLTLYAEVDATAAVMALIVPSVAVPVVLWAGAHEDEGGLRRLLALLVGFVGVMELVVVAADVLTLLIGWELVTAASWALIAHHWRDPARPAAAATAFNTTRFGGLGLVLTAGAALASTGSLRYADLAEIGGAFLHVAVAGVVVAAATKSAQAPFSAWLFPAMAGPTPASALLHSATMVAAGAYVLVRLYEPLSLAPWFEPTVLGLGLATAIAGSVVAAVQGHVKRLLAGSTSAQYGLMFVAIGVGAPAVALAHLTAHAAFKALLFLAAGSAAAAARTEDIRRMGVGSRLPSVAALSLVAVLALAAVPPLGGAWTKEHIVAAAGHHASWLLLLVVVAGGLTAFYAARFQLLAFGPARHEQPARGAPGRADRVETAAIAVLASASLALGVAWLPGARSVVTGLAPGPVRSGPLWELVLSLAAVIAGLAAAWVLHQRRSLPAMGVNRVSTWAADWFSLPALARRVIVTPTQASASALGRFDARVVDASIGATAARAHRVAGWFGRLDDRGVDAGVRGVARLARWWSGVSTRIAESGVDGAVDGLARLVGRAGGAARGVQTGMVHHFYVVAAIGAAVLAVAATVWRS